jgi:catechol 2,3-dioxygenase-like lactoylglutathione lyase family enzyme
MRHLVDAVAAGSGRLAAAAAALALLGAGTAGAGEATAELAFVASGELWVSTADGSSPTRLASDHNITWPAWSPDGTRLAFVRWSSLNRSRLALVDADGTNVRTPLDDASSQIVAPPVWSPDGTRIALIRRTSSLSRVDIWIVRVDTGDALRLTDDGDYESGVRWRGSTELFYSTTDDGGRVWTIAASGGPRRSFVPGVSLPVPSPDGSRLAYVRADAPSAAATLHVADPDGLGARPLPLPDWHVSTLAWSPDGRRIAVSAYRTISTHSRFGPHVEWRAFIVDVAGGGWLPLGVVAPAVQPIWWPSGDRLLLQESTGRVAMVEADGDCPQPFELGGREVAYVAWRPGAAPAPPPLRCVHLTAPDEPGPFEIGRRGTRQFVFGVGNAGNVRARRVVLTLSGLENAAVLHLSSSQGSCAAAERPLRCDLGDLDPGRRIQVELRVRALRLGSIRVRALVSADAEPGVRLAPGETLTGVNVLDCDVVGTWGPDVLRGTHRRDVICARPGADRIDGRGGADRIEAGSGDDTTVGGPGRDPVGAGAGATWCSRATVRPT